MVAPQKSEVGMAPKSAGKNAVVSARTVNGRVLIQAACDAGVIVRQGGLTKSGKPSKTDVVAETPMYGCEPFKLGDEWFGAAFKVWKYKNAPTKDDTSFDNGDLAALVG